MEFCIGKTWQMWIAYSFYHSLTWCRQYLKFRSFGSFLDGWSIGATGTWRNINWKRLSLMPCARSGLWFTVEKIFRWAAGHPWKARRSALLPLKSNHEACQNLRSVCSNVLFIHCVFMNLFIVLVIANIKFCTICRGKEACILAAIVNCSEKIRFRLLNALVVCILSIPCQAQW